MAADSSTATPSAKTRVLGRDDVCVLYSFTAGVAESECGAAYALLSEPERDRGRRFRFEEDRVSFIVAHALARAALSRFAAAGSGRSRWRAG